MTNVHKINQNKGRMANQCTGICEKKSDVAGFISKDKIEYILNDDGTFTPVKVRYVSSLM